MKLRILKMMVLLKVLSQYETHTANACLLDGQPPSKKFAALKPRLRYIPQDVIKNKWEVLPEHIQGRVRELFVAVGRPVITQYRDERRRIGAQAALSSIKRTLVP